MTIASTLTLAAGGGGGAVQLNLLIILSCAGVITLLLSRLRVAAIPAYLLAGIAIGPGGLSLVSSPDGIEQIGQMALIVLMFSIGMHLDASAVRKGATSIVIVGVLSTLAGMAAMWGILTLCGVPGRGALAAAMGLSMSSTAVVMRLYTQRRELQSSAGRSALGILLVQDLLVIGFLAVLPVLADGAPVDPAAAASAAEGLAQSVRETEPMSWLDRIGQVVFAIGAIAALIAGGKLVIPRLLREASRIAGGEVMLVLTAAVGLGAATLTGWLGLSAELGAFIAGFLLAGTPFRHQLAGQLAPVRDLFMAIFFTAIGLQVDLESIMPVWWVIPLGTVSLIVLKFLIIGGTSWVLGVEGGLAARVGSSLAQAGEFSLVVFSVAIPLGLLTGDQGSVLVGIVIASLIVTPGLMGLGPRIAPFAQRIGGPPWRRGKGSTVADDDGLTPEGAVIVAGFGVVGRTCVERIEQAGGRVVLVELNPTTVREQTAAGRTVVFGDISNPDVLESVGIGHAAAVVLAVLDSDATMRAVRTIRAARSDIHIAVRVGMQHRADAVRALGADLIVVEEEVSAAALAQQVIARCQLAGVSQEIQQDAADELEESITGQTRV
jgi:monovalent cation:H+ antiporter-2, CPA2 family